MKLLVPSHVSPDAGELDSSFRCRARGDVFCLRARQRSHRLLLGAQAHWTAPNHEDMPARRLPRILAVTPIGRRCTQQCQRFDRDQK